MTKKAKPKQKKLDLKKTPQIWTIEEVLNLEKRQHLSSIKPHLCACRYVLTATTRGWYCENCDAIVKTWASKKELAGDFSVKKEKKR